MNRRVIFNHVVLLFLIGSVFGTYFEEAVFLVRHFLGTGSLQWASRRGLLYGPLSPVYGLGAIMVYFICYRRKWKFWKCWIAGALIGGLLEVVLSILQEKLFGTLSWDYRGWFLNICGGRTNLVYMAIWGLIIAIFSCFVFPWLEKLYDKIPEGVVNPVCIVVAVLLVADIGISIAASYRQGLRRSGVAPRNGVEVFLDEHYTDERMRRTYENAKYVRD